jgi:glycosyltransferase involved in cell wall biosynthesis
MTSVENKISVSVLTPTWNRAALLGRVWEGLNAQSGVSFEWIVGNDGSTDGTSEAIEAFAAHSDFPVTLIDASVRIGKTCMDNLLVAAARGEVVVWCDSDDVLNQNALRQLLDSWEEVLPDRQHEYMGVSARIETQDGVLGTPFGMSMEGKSWNDIYFHLNSDLTIMARTELMRKTPFLEVDFLIPETSVWNVLGVMQTKFVDAPLKTVYYKQVNALSFSGKMQYSRGRAYALGGNYRFVCNRLGVRGEFMRAVNFIRYCAHGEVPVSVARRTWTGRAISHAMLALGALPAGLLVIRDRMRGVVEKTHIEFESNRRDVQITRKTWEGSC